MTPRVAAVAEQLAGARAAWLAHADAKALRRALHELLRVLDEDQ